MKDYKKQNLEKYNGVRDKNYKINTEPFKLCNCNGEVIKIIRSPEELIICLETMEYSVFNHHVINKDGENDFALWIEKTFGNPEKLANKLKGAKTTEEMLKILKPYKSYDWYESKFKTPKT